MTELDFATTCFVSTSGSHHTSVSSFLMRVGQGLQRWKLAEMGSRSLLMPTWRAFGSIPALGWVRGEWAVVEEGYKESKPHTGTLGGNSTKKETLKDSF